MYAFLFPGQGSQKIGMGHDFAQASPAARAVFEEVDDTLNQHLSRTIFSGEPHQLNQTENTQPALFAVSMAIVRACEEALGKPLALYVGSPDSPSPSAYAAGHSLGEYSALTFANALSIAQAAKLLQLRATAMQKATPLDAEGKTIGGMCAILGLELEKCKIVAEQAAQQAEKKIGKPQVCVVANDNSETQVVVSGHSDAIDLVPAYAKEQGAKRTVPLPVSAPFHSPLMQPAADTLQKPLAQTTWKPLTIPIISNVSAQAENDVSRFADLLTQQITAQVRWRETMNLLSNSVTHAVELGAGTVLSTLLRKAHPHIAVSSVASYDNLEPFLQQLNP